MSANTAGDNYSFANGTVYDASGTVVGSYTTDATGNIDSVSTDEDGNGYVDTVVADLDHNGSFESAVVDANADGYGETVLVDTDNDGDFDTSTCPPMRGDRARHPDPRRRLIVLLVVLSLAFGGVVARLLLRVDDVELPGVRHRRPAGGLDGGRALGAAVEHYDHRQGLVLVSAGHVQFVGTATSFGRVRSSFPLPDGWRHKLGRKPPPGLAAQRKLAKNVGHWQPIQFRVDFCSGVWVRRGRSQAQPASDERRRLSQTSLTS